MHEIEIDGSGESTVAGRTPGDRYPQWGGSATKDAESGRTGAGKKAHNRSAATQ